MVKNRSPIVVILLTFITFGFYGLYWFVKTKGEMVEMGADIPTAFLIIIPIANIFWYWKYSKGVEQVSGGQTSGVLVFLLLLFILPIGQYMAQAELNKHAGGAPAQPAATEPAEEAKPAKK